MYSAKIVWSSDGTDFRSGKYSREHSWSFDGGVEVKASSSPHVVPLPFSVEHAIDPEEAFVASLSSCHMLWFLSIAAKKGFSVMSYTDESSGIMGKNGEGKVAMLSVTLRPEVKFTGANQPSFDVIKSMHEASHAECFIASSVKTKILCEPVFA
ncbi:OsmC family protein [Cellvibrio polysaccharolyticus]|uniref:Peroxiredoxin n=1 Tax=Cellvibrio polysaccharolyticus TaxID=2082724 RepID=A0A928YSZ5_9GAMM|nr:OsmC family protein [Cellvibrio polysaccharolyticus]MBE8715830.1 peroxiredoxin [Cellvibrio polysaccharolyticus]